MGLKAREFQLFGPLPALAPQPRTYHPCGLRAACWPVDWSVRPDEAGGGGTRLLPKGLIDRESRT